MFSRRKMLQATASIAGLSSLNWLQLSAAIKTKSSRKKRCVLIWLDGGPSQLDTLDPKPNAPGGHGGPLKPISTSVPGIQISETLPGIARHMDKCALIRSMSTKERSHSNGRFQLHTGYMSTLNLNFPSIGAVVSYFQDDEQSDAPHYVHLGGGDSHGCSSGFLGARHSPLKVANQIPYLRPRVKPDQFRRRVDLLRELENSSSSRQESLFLDHRLTLEKTLSFMNSKFPLAFDFRVEPAAVRERYGETKIGAACLQARRLLEQDVSFVEVNSTHWDMHGGIYSSKSTGIKSKAAILDQAVCALIEDLESIGLLDDTLIVWMGEFGRTPIMKGSGRDHFSAAWSTMMIGGGIQGGQVIGKTDETGETVTDRPVSAADFLATVYHRLGIDHRREIIGPGNRPLHLVDRQDSAEIIESLL